MTTPATDVIYTPVFSSSTPRTAASRFADFVSVKDFGAKGDNTTDDTAAIQNAINYAGASGGGAIYFPPGRYIITSPINFVNTKVAVFGAGRGNTFIVQRQLSGYGFLVTASDFECSAMQFTYDGLPAGGASIFLNGAAQAHLHDLIFDHCFVGVLATNSSGSSLHDFLGFHCVESAVSLYNTNDFFIRSFLIYTTVQTWMTGGGIRLANFCEAIVVSDGDIVGGVHPLTIDSASYSQGARPAYNRFTNVYFDSSSLGVYCNNSILTNFDSCWFSSGRVGGGQSGLTLWQTRGFNFNNCTFFNNGTNGAVVYNGSTKTRFMGCNFESNGATNPVGSAGLAVGTNTQNLTVQSCTFGNGLYSGSQAYGMYIDSGTSDNLTVMGCDFVGGGTTAGFLDNSGGAQKIINSNRV